MMEAISQQSNIESSHDHEECNTKEPLNKTGIEKNDENDSHVDTDMANEELCQADIKDTSKSSELTAENLEKISIRKELDTIKSTETEENEANQSFAIFKDVEENCDEKEEAKIKESNLNDDEKYKTIEYDDDIEDEMKSMHSPENAEEYVNVSKGQELFKSEENDEEKLVDQEEKVKQEVRDDEGEQVHQGEQIDQKAQVNQQERDDEGEQLDRAKQIGQEVQNDQEEQEAVASKVDKEQIQAEIEIDDSSDSSTNEVSNIDYETRVDNKGHENDDEHQLTAKSNSDENSGKDEDEDKEIVSISDEESIQSINDKQDAEQIDTKNTNFSNENNIEQQNIINIDDESHDEMQVSQGIVPEEKPDKESDCLTANEGSQDKFNEEIKELEQIISYKDANIENLNENNAAELTENISRNSPIELLNGNEDIDDDLQIIDADEDSNQNKPQDDVKNIANEKCDDEKPENVCDASLINVISNDNSLVNCIKRQFLKMDNTTTELPKLNGDHKVPETDQIHTSVIEIHGNSRNLESAKISEIELNRETLSSGEEDDIDKDNFESNLQIIDEDVQQLLVTAQTEASPHPTTIAAIEKSPMQPIQIDLAEDECSRSSIASSTATSSSLHLVIDDTETVTAKKSNKQRRNAKLTRKRKLSQNSDKSELSPQPKQAHLDMDLEPEPMVNTVLNVDSEMPSVNFQLKEDSKQISIPIISENLVAPIVLHKSSEALVQSPPTCSSPLLNSLLVRKQLETMDKLVTTENKLNNTKYLCFNCKSGCFDSLIALNEHQRQCLANKSLLPPSIAPTANTPPQSPGSGATSQQKNVSQIQLSENTTVEKLRYYKCSSCGTFHENWNLFLHIREIHKRHMCLYCIRMFPTAEKLSLHLEIKHDLEQNHFNSEEALRKSLADTTQTESGSENMFLMCCTCQHVFPQSEPFSDHICSEYMQACDLCGQKGRHTNQCKAQTEAKRSRVKKKAKAKESNSGRLQSLKSDAPHFMTPQSEPFPNPPQIMAPYCDNAPIQTTIPPSNSSQTQSHSQHIVPQQQQNEDSNSSCNMIIDETCNNTNYSRITPYNPFKVLDERERLEQQTALSEPPLPPERYIGGTLEQAMEKPAPIQPLIVPKFKLRVPKEFQKSVDAAISSTESEDDEANEEDVDTSHEVLPAVSTTLKVPQTNAAAAESATESATEVPNTQEEADENTGHLMAVDEEDSLDEPNSKLARILQEIERTRLDIMRTKDALQTAKSPINASNQQRSATISQSSSRTGGERNWTPTPPASPNPQWITPRRALSNNEKEENEEKNHHEFREDFVPPRNLIPIENQERRDTTGSEIDMDIDETISGQPTMCIQRSASHEVTEDTKLTEEVKTEIINNQMDTSNENSSMNIDEFSGSKASAEEHSNTFGSDQSDHTQDRTVDDPPKEDEPPIVEEPKTYVPQQSPKAETPPAKATEKQDDHVDACVQENQLTENHEPPADGIEIADDDTIPVDLQLDRPLEKFQIVEFVRICLKAVYPLCLYCNHARRIAVNGKSLVLHLIAQHRFAATVDSITAEELQPGTIVTKLKSYLPELDEHFLNSTSYCTMGDGAYTRHFNERIFECFQCRFVTSTHKELYLHNRKMHIKTAILCFMCRANFFSFSEILCHICPGEPNKTSVFDVKFRCCLCDVDNIPSPFRLMVHLRKKHFACDVCLEDCRDQGRLSSHVWKHKLHHLCYRCGIAYRNKMDITKHLFWKHGTESIICKRCLQKRWRHVYHFCIPPSNFICDVCTLCFSKATYLKVHKRIHTGDLRYPCTEDNCELKFISRRLLLKHTAEHQLPELTEKTASDVAKQEEKTEQKSEEQILEEVKIKNEKLEDAEVQEVKDEIKADESKQQDIKTAAVANKTSPLEDSKIVAVDAQKPEKRKKKKTKRNKESLEDLNLIAPNLSESDSSDDSDVESKSKSGEDALVPNVMLSPLSETENEKESKDKSGTGKVLDIWKNFLQAQSGSAGGTDDHRNDTDYTEDYYPTPNLLHVVQSDHDYCVMFKPVQQHLHYGGASQTSPVKSRKTTAKSPRRTSARRSDASSSSSGSSSSSDSSCSCGSNCSCSSSNSDSSSSSSSSDSSSAASNASRKRHRKKSERPRKKSESASPTKKHSIREQATAKTNASGVVDDDVNVGTEEPAPRSPSPPKEPLFYESDLETAESETDEEFYDEHPQKLASELLAQKRAQLMAQTRLSPSHNYDIVENSRPSTPSLPDEVAREKKVKLKKKKRERKSTSRSMTQSGSVPSLKLAFGNAPPPALNAENIAAATAQQQSALPLEVAKSSLHEMLPSYDLMRQSTNITETAVTQEQQHASHQQLTPRPIGPQHHTGRMSEGSSCSDADASLKRSKRARRPNKFYGYTSDDENNMSGLGQPLMIGMRAIKPQPPPQLTWRKEDLPTPSKSIINNKIKTPRLPKTPSTLPVGPFGASVLTPATLKKKRVRNTVVTPGGGGDKPPRKRLTKKAAGGSAKLPPIPTLKIRPSQIGLTPTNTAPNAAIGAGGTNHIPASQIYSSSKESDDEEEDSTDSSSDDEATQKLLLNTPVASTSKARLWNAAFQQVPTTATPAIVPPAQATVVFQASLVLPPVLPAAPPPPPTPQASAFNQKIPPALLPNPDFATLQYFKANNIRYPIRPPAGARQAREGESVYCYCRCPYDEVSEMIACDGDNCLIEWFHFECVGIMVAPQGKWFCAECRPKYSEELYPASKA